MTKAELQAQIWEEIDKSISDDVLVRSEKRELKALLIKFAPDKAACDLLRSEIFSLAQSRANPSNYQAILKWVEDLNKVLLSVQKQEKLDERVYFSPGEDCLNAILHQINSSVQIIQICLFTISDNRISDALVTKHKHGTHIKIITDNDKIYDQGSDIQVLHEAGIPVKVDVTDNHMHHKFALFDKKTTITGSYNWTRSAERYNHENIIISNSPKMMREFEDEYDKLWNELIYYGEL
ncbi:MAG: DUF1669 domain-containing protein [Crocinitomicaceae bacterium]|nr:DUF1669 domain-containing protein [Crocinitomicaceae bacterium]